MSWTEVYLLCFVIGGLWSLVTVLGGAGLLSHGHIGHGHGGHTRAGHGSSFFGSIIHPSGIAIFLAWFGATGYLLRQHTALGALVTLIGSAALGVLGMLVLGLFLQWLQKHEKPLDPADYRMTGILGRVSSPIRPDGVGEVIYLRDGARTPLAAKSDIGVAVAKDEEVIVTRYEKGIAYVRTWDSMTGETVSTPKKEESL